ARVAPDRKVSIEREIFPALVRDRSVYALGSDALWTDMGTPENYLEANLAWAAREGSLVEGGGAVRDGVHPRASVRNSVLGAGTAVAEDAVVEGSVLLNGARVMAGALVRGSVVGPDAEVGPKAVVEELTVLGQGYRVGAGEVVSGQRLPPA
ncbi:MAG TPA: NDP-sugar synthase, partial [Acidimicrobiales bacterium]|nr:NDP-sugar synthase [Acidimicrobiales bacterium]